MPWLRPESLLLARRQLDEVKARLYGGAVPDARGAPDWADSITVRDVSADGMATIRAQTKADQ